LLLSWPIKKEEDGQSILNLPSEFHWMGIDYPFFFACPKKKQEKSPVRNL